MDQKTEETHPTEEELTLLKILLKENIIFENPIILKENLSEIRGIIQNLPELYFVANFHFEYEGKIVNEYVELSEALEIESLKELNLQIVFDDYDLRSLKDLIEKINSFFKRPKEVAATLNCKDHIDAKLTLEKVLELELNTLTHISGDQSIKPSIDKANNYVKLLEYSSWNPPPRRRKIIGDYFYLRVITLEGQEFHITAFSKGFYVQKSTAEIFDPTANSIPYFNLLDLLAEKSTIFKAKIDQGLFKSLNLSVRNIQLPTSRRPQPWLTLDEEIDTHMANNFESGRELFNNHGYSMNIYRDWSEELYSCRQIPEDEFYSKMNKKKQQNRITQDFLEAATDGAKAIIDGDLKPFNYNLPEAEQCFVYNNIFFTYAIDNYMDLNQKRLSTAPSTLSLANTDLRNMSILQNSSITPVTGTKRTHLEENDYTKAEDEAPPLRTINTAIIYYKGHSMIAQSMIQGILYFDHATWGKYGSIDDGKTINFDEGFDKQMKVISKLFGVKEGLKFKDGEGKEWTLNSSIEVKGIQGGDGRKYILDFLRTSPRDLNWGFVEKNPPKEIENGSEKEKAKNGEKSMKVTEKENYQNEGNLAKNSKVNLNGKTENSKTAEPSDPSKEVQLGKLCSEQGDEAKDYNCCVFRLGMLKNYILNKKMEVAQEIKKTYHSEIQKCNSENIGPVQEKIKEAKKVHKIKETEALEKGESAPKLDLSEFKDELKIATDNINKGNLEISQKIESQFEEKLKNLDLDNLRFNQCIATPLPSYVESEEQLEKDTNLLLNLAKFAKTKMVNRAIIELQSMQRLSPLDTSSLGEFLHKFSINIRYLGLFAEKINSKTHPSLAILIRRAILVRCIKHFINEAIREIPEIQLSQTITHLINCVLSSKICAKHIDDKVAKLRIGIKKKSEEEEKIQNGKKKRKKAKKLNKMKIRQVDCGLQPNRYMLLTPKDLLSEMNKISSYKFKFEFQEKNFYEMKTCSSKSTCMAFFRDISKSIGLVLRIREYIFRDPSMTKASIRLPLNDTDIIDFKTRTKSTMFEFTESKQNFEAAKTFVKQKKYGMAKELYSQILQMNLTVYGPFNVNTIQPASQLANLLYMSNKIEDAISVQKNIVEICEKTFGVDNINTINALSDLAKFYFRYQMPDKAIENLLKALYLSDLIGGEFCINSLSILEELQSMYFNQVRIEEAVGCVHEKIERLSRLYPEGDIFILNQFKSAAKFYHNLGLYHKAIEMYRLTLSFLEKYQANSSEKVIKATQKIIDELQKKINSGNSLDYSQVASQIQAKQQQMQALLLKKQAEQENLMKQKNEKNAEQYSQKIQFFQNYQNPGKFMKI